MNISATLTRCRDKKPLVVLDSRPFNGLEIRPDELRILAQELLRLANAAAALPTGRKSFCPVKIEIGPEGCV
ncbi:MAG: hypothetical protein LBE62_03050 [Azonexus sp.]|jgi:hypothetical protein|nr:hypothetical protein [Azonexus sp.]